MKFDIPKDYFLDEVRDGFFVPSMIKKSWAVSIIDYKILEEICDKLGLNIFFMYGSLIAVIRHAGSIPWDDDIDSMMFHDEYQKLKDFLENGGLPENFRMNDYTQMGTGNLVRKWLDNVDAIKSRDRWEESFGFPFVNNIDVMLIDYLPDGEKNLQYYTDVVGLLQYVKDFADDIEAGSEDYDKAEFEYSLDLLERVLKVKYDKEKDGRLSIWTWKMLDRFTVGYTARESSEVASVAHYMTHGNGKFPKRLYQGYIDMPYEFTTVKVPVGYDAIAKDFFGDYMTPKLEWDGHIYPFYRNLESALREKFDIELLKYHYRESDVRKVLAEKADKVRFSDTLAYSSELFKEAHGFICEVLSDETGLSEEAVNELLGVLGSCQELAVNLGEVAEKLIADKSMTERIVGRLEGYCEYVYGIYQAVSGEVDAGTDTDGTRERFVDFESFLSEILSEDIVEKKKVVFLCWRSKYWSSLHTIWEAAIEDETVDVTVIAVPYYIKDYEGKTSKDEMIIDTEEYYESVKLTPYDEYDFEAEHPDIVIYQEPYDEYSDAFTVHPYYYSSNIRKYTEKMVFIPPFVVREVSSGDERSKYTIGCFACNPGLVFADMVIVQSDGMRDVYISVLKDMVKRDVRYVTESWVPDERDYESTDFAGEEKGLIDAYDSYVPADAEVARLLNWEDKIFAFGSALTDWNERSRIIIRDESSMVLYDKVGNPVKRTAYDEIVNVPGEWIGKLKKEDGSFRKILLYPISAGIAFEYGEEVFEKAKDAIKMIENYHAGDIKVIFFADRNYRDALRKNNPSAWKACQEFISFVKAGEHIYDDSLDEIRAAKICDACYGDASSVLNKCREFGRPVMLQSPDIKITEG